MGKIGKTYFGQNPRFGGKFGKIGKIKSAEKLGFVEKIGKYGKNWEKM